MKEELIQVLEEECMRMEERGVSVLDHKQAIQYLKTGAMPNDYVMERLEDYPITESAIYDLKTLSSDYL